MQLDEDLIQAEIREIATGSTALTAIVPISSMHDEFPAADVPFPRIGFRMADRTAAHVDQGKACGWAASWDLVVEDEDSGRIKSICALLETLYDGVGGRVGDVTIRVLVHSVSGTTYDPETRTRARVVTLMVLVQPAG